MRFPCFAVDNIDESDANVHWRSVRVRSGLISPAANATLSRNISLSWTALENTLYWEIKQCGRNGVPRKFLDKLTTQLHYTTRRKMDEDALAGIMFCFPNCNLFEGFNGCRIKTSRPRSGFSVCQPAMIDEPLSPCTHSPRARYSQHICRGF